jgi:leader peptidase (prepilin peptidase) / N-methyltransferase
MDAFFPVIAVSSGLVLGSFFNVLIHRIPRKESIVVPPSHCPRCGRSIRPWENIPLLSYLMLRGRCAGCGKPISMLYPAVELLTAVAAYCAFLFFVVPETATATHPTLWAIITIIVQTSVLMVAIPVAVIDLFHFMIPDSITLSGLALGVLVSFLPGGITPLECLLGIVAGGGSLFVIGLLGEWIFKRGEAMGGGDVKLMAFCGAIFGWKIALLTIVLASFIGATAGISLILARVFPKDHKIPFGPFLACGLWVAVLFGNRLLTLYQMLIDRLAG